MAVPGAVPNPILQTGNQTNYLSWDITPTATGYSVQRSTDGVNFSNLATPTLNNYLDSTVTIGSQYYYQVAGTNGSGTGIYTATSPTSAVPTLPGQSSLGDIRLRAQQRADMVNSQFVTTTEWNDYINKSYYELYDLLITVYEDYYVSPRLLFTTDGSQMYALPNGKNYSSAPALYKLFGVDCGLSNNINAFASLKKFPFIQRNRYVYPQLSTTLLGIFDLQYRVIGNNLMFIPTPAQGQTLGLWYFPRLTTLLADSDMMDGFSGWEEYVIVDAARKALAKEESDTSELNNEKMMLIKRINDSAADRDAGMSDTIADSRMDYENFGTYGFGPSAGD